MIAQSPHLTPDQFIAVRCRIGQLALFQNFRPEFRDNIEKAERDLPPVGKIIGRNAGKLTPFGIVGFDLIHQASQITRKPNRVRGCCGNRNIIDAKQRPHMRRQRFSPWANEPRQQQQPFSLANWRIKIEYAACGCVEKSRILIHIAQRANGRKDRRFSRIHIYQDGTKRTRCTARRHIDGRVR